LINSEIAVIKTWPNSCKSLKIKMYLQLKIV
jgi:hypothetical protein